LRSFSAGSLLDFCALIPNSGFSPFGAIMTRLGDVRRRRRILAAFAAGP
jgi:hypothetical protein